MSFQAAHNVANVHQGPRILSNLRVSCATCNLHSGVAVYDTNAATERDGKAFPPRLAETDARAIVNALYEGRSVVPVALLPRNQCLYPGRRTGLTWIDAPTVFRPVEETDPVGYISPSPVGTCL